MDLYAIVGPVVLTVAFAVAGWLGAGLRPPALWPWAWIALLASGVCEAASARFPSLDVLGGAFGAAFPFLVLAAMCVERRQRIAAGWVGAGLAVVVGRAFLPAAGLEDVAHATAAVVDPGAFLLAAWWVYRKSTPREAAVRPLLAVSLVAVAGAEALTAARQAFELVSPVTTRLTWLVVGAPHVTLQMLSHLRSVESSRDAARARLHRADHRFRALAENAADLIAEIDGEGRVVYVNGRVEDLLGFPPEVVVGQRLLPVIHPDLRDDAARRLGDARPEATDGLGRIRVRGKRGEWIWLEFTASSFETREGEFHRVLVAHDVTSRVDFEAALAQSHQDLEEQVKDRTRDLEAANERLRLLQSRLIRAERYAAEAQLAGSVAHVLQNPLAALMGSAQMLREEVPNSRLAQEVERLSKRIAQVVERTLSLFRAGDLERAVHRPEHLMEEAALALSERAKEEAVRIDLACDARLPDLRVDGALLIEALASVGANAIDAMVAHGGNRVLSLQVRAEHEGIVQFLVCDTGPGVPEEILGDLFDPFFTTKPGGTGLGLAIARGAVSAHGGAIRICNRPEGGAAVQLSLPVSSGDGATLDLH